MIARGLSNEENKHFHVNIKDAKIRQEGEYGDITGT
jgi:hypothetical protein